jgi:hypothetical protein
VFNLNKNNFKSTIFFPKNNFKINISIKMLMMGITVLNYDICIVLNIWGNFQFVHLGQLSYSFGKTALQWTHWMAVYEYRKPDFVACSINSNEFNFSALIIFNYNIIMCYLRRILCNIIFLRTKYILYKF